MPLHGSTKTQNPAFSFDFHNDTIDPLRILPIVSQEPPLVLLQHHHEDFSTGFTSPRIDGYPQWLFLVGKGAPRYDLLFCGPEVIERPPFLSKSFDDPPDLCPS